MKLDTRKRYHAASSEIRAFLVDENNKVLNGGNGKEKVVCEDMENYFVRFSYDTDCKIEVRYFICRFHCFERNIHADHFI